MNEVVLKKKAGQAGNADSNPYVRCERLEIRVSPHEKKLIQKNSIDKGFDNVAQFIREQSKNPGRAVNPNETYHAFIACQYQLNRIGNNLNQIAHYLNSGGEFDSEAFLALKSIQEQALNLLRDAKSHHGGRP